MTAIVSLEALTYRYPGASAPALRDVSLDIEAGELVLLAGASGSGKSTLLRTACGLVPHVHGGEVSGRAEVAGMDVREHGPGELSDAYPNPPGSDRSDSQVAAPFTVPAGLTWSVTGARVVGSFDNATDGFVPGTGEYKVNVFIYRNDPVGTIAQPPVYQALGVTPTNAPIENGDPGDPNFEVTIPSVKLPAGEYWFSIQYASAWHLSSEHIEWLWTEEPSQQSLGSNARAATPASSAPLLALSGTTAAPGTACGTVSPAEDNFSPRRPKVPTLLGVRAKLTASAPSDFTVTAAISHGGKVTRLGTYDKRVITFKKLRMPVPSDLGLKRLDKVVLFLHAVIRPLGSSTCTPVTKDFTVKRRVFNIQQSLADR